MGRKREDNLAGLRNVTDWDWEREEEGEEGLPVERVSLGQWKSDIYGQSKWNKSRRGNVCREVREDKMNCSSLLS